MISLTSMFNLSQQALVADQAALNITANNGANDLHVGDIKLLSDEPMPNAPISPLIHWSANDAADRERAIARQKAVEAVEPGR